MPVRQGDVRAGGAYIELGILNKLSKGLTKPQLTVKRFARNIADSLRPISLIGAGLFTGFGFAVKNLADFSDEMQTVKAITEGTEAQFKALEEQAKRLGRTTSFTAVEVAQGQVAIGRSRGSREDVRGLTDDVITLARATRTDLPLAAKIANDTLNTFGFGVDQAGRVVDNLTLTANNSSQTLEDLGESLKFIGPIAQESNLSLEDTLALLGTLADVNLRGTLGGTAIRRILENLTDFKKASQIEAAFGITIDDAALSDLPKTVGRLLDKIGDLPNTQKLGILNELFDVRGAGAAAVAGGNTDKINQFRKRFEEGAGAAAKAAKTIDAEIGGTIRRITSAAEGLRLGFAETFGDEFGDIGEKIARTINVITTWIGENKKLVASIVRMIVILTGAAGLGFALATVATLLSGPAGLILLLSTAGLAALEASGAISSLTTKLGELNEAALLAAENNSLAEVFDIIKLRFRQMLLEMKRDIAAVVQGGLTGVGVPNVNTGFLDSIDRAIKRIDDQIAAKLVVIAGKSTVKAAGKAAFDGIPRNPDGSRKTGPGAKPKKEVIQDIVRRASPPPNGAFDVFTNALSLSAGAGRDEKLAAQRKTNGLLEKLIKVNEEQKKALDKQLAFGA